MHLGLGLEGLQCLLAGGSSSSGLAALTLGDILPVGALAAAVNLEESG